MINFTTTQQAIVFGRRDRWASLKGSDFGGDVSDLTERIQLTPEERELLLKHGYPFDRLAKSLRRHASSPAITTILMSAYELEMLIGELSRSINHGERGQDEDAVIDLCNRLEYAERWGMVS